MTFFVPFFRTLRDSVCLLGLLLGAAPPPAEAQAQTPPTKNAKPQSETKEPAEPYSLELLETRIRFESNSSGRRETHARAHINNELGAGQFGRLSFDYNRAFEQIDIPFVRITHARGGTVDILPGAITDQPNPAVADAPAYHDVRRTSVRILGLLPGDILEYRVVNTVSRAPLAPEFYLSHSFARGAIVSREFLELDVPADRAIQLRSSPSLPAASVEGVGEGAAARKIYRWTVSSPAPDSAQGDAGEVTITSFPSWEKLSAILALEFLPRMVKGDQVREKSAELIRGARTDEEKLQAIYDFVSQKIRTVDLPLGAMGFSPRRLENILSSGYANPEEKAFLLATLAANVGLRAHPVLMTGSDAGEGLLPLPSVFSRVLVMIGKPPAARWLDPSTEVAPFGMIHSRLRGKPGLVLTPVRAWLEDANRLWLTTPLDLPFAARQQVRVDATLADDGKFTAKVRYVMRGDNELILRTAFHGAPKDQWKGLAQLLSISDGFRGAISNVIASDPLATREPFTVEYEITQPKFVDWSKPPVRIRAALPLLGLPDLPERVRSGSKAPAIDLGTPLEIEAHGTLRLPPHVLARVPANTSVDRDYATYASSYVVKGSVFTASRHMKFILREIPAGRIADYTAFVRAVQNDEAQEFNLERAGPGSAIAPEPKKPAAQPPQP